jgi:hypothetical protein
VSVGTAVALVLALVSTTLINLAYLQEHDAAAELPVLSMRRPLHSAGLLLRERSWLIGFAMESVGFLLYAVALALAELALVQSIAAGGIGVLAFASARLARRRLRRRELLGVLISIVGLVALGISLAGGSSEGGQGTTASILLWLGITAGVAILFVLPGRKPGWGSRGVRVGCAAGSIRGRRRSHTFAHWPVFAPGPHPNRPCIASVASTATAVCDPLCRSRLIGGREAFSPHWLALVVHRRIAKTGLASGCAPQGLWRERVTFGGSS